MLLDKLKAHGAIAAALALGALLLVQTGRLHFEQLAHQKLKTQVAQDATKRSDAALKNETKVGLKEFGHAAATQENSDAFTTSQPVRDAIARADAARHVRLLDGAEKRAATYRAMAEAGAAACRDLADRHQALDRQLVEGVAVVGALRSDLGRRDSEVALLRRQIDTDRMLLEP